MMQEVDSFSESPTGQRLKSDIDDFQDWVQNSNAEDQIREELIKALNIANTELKKVADKLSAIDSATDEPTEEESETASSGDEVADG